MPRSRRIAMPVASMLPARRNCIGGHRTAQVPWRTACGRWKELNGGVVLRFPALVSSNGRPVPRRPRPLKLDGRSVSFSFEEGPKKADQVSPKLDNDDLVGGATLERRGAN